MSEAEWQEWEAALLALEDKLAAPRRWRAFSIKLSRIEKASVARALSEKLSPEDLPSFREFKRRADLELYLCDAHERRSDRSAIVGSGTMPITSILLSKRYNVTGIDVDEEAVAMAEQYTLMAAVERNMNVRTRSTMTFQLTELLSWLDQLRQIRITRKGS